MEKQITFYAHLHNDGTLTLGQSDMSQYHSFGKCVGTFTRLIEWSVDDLERPDTAALEAQAAEIMGAADEKAAQIRDQLQKVEAFWGGGK